MEDEEQELHELLLEKARRDILSFTLLTKDDYRINWHHRNLSDKLNAFAKGDIQYLMVFMPPRHGKSELVSKQFPAFLHGLYPDCEIMAASYLESLASDMCIGVQKVIDSQIYREIFPETRIYPAGTRHKIRSTVSHEIMGRRGIYRGQGVGGSFTGKGANFIVIDDPIKGRKDADSEAFRERLWNFWKGDLFSRLETNLKTGRKGQVLITQTRWHEDDLSGRIIEQMRKDPTAAQFEIISYPAIRIDKDDASDPREIGDPLWPEKYDLKQLMQTKATSDLREWESLYQQNPTPIGGNQFKEKMFSFCDIPKKFDFTFITADTAYKEKKENDFTCFSAWGCLNKEIYLIDLWMKQIKASDIEEPAEEFIRRHQKYGFRFSWIEPKGHGIYLNQKFAQKGLQIPNEQMLKDFYDDRRMDKLERANNVIPHLTNRKVFIGNNIPQKETVVAQALSFPKVKHDDFVDTLVDALKIVYSHEVGILDVL